MLLRVPRAQLGIWRDSGTDQLRFFDSVNASIGVPLYSLGLGTRNVADLLGALADRTDLVYRHNYLVFRSTRAIGGARHLVAG